MVSNDRDAVELKESQLNLQTDKRGLKTSCRMNSGYGALYEHGIQLALRGFS